MSSSHARHPYPGNDVKDGMDVLHCSMAIMTFLFAYTCFLMLQVEVQMIVQTNLRPIILVLHHCL
jgi:hypothetical protein